jgi:hypothetical protein
MRLYLGREQKPGLMRRIYIISKASFPYFQDALRELEQCLTSSKQSEARAQQRIKALEKSIQELKDKV